MTKIACVFILLAVMVGAMVFVGGVHASSLVGGLITSDTAWTLADSPYRLSGTVMVNAGVTLTIEPGVVVDFYMYSILVSGTLNAQGTSDNNIVFQTSYPQNNPSISFLSGLGWDEALGSGNIIKNAVVSSIALYINNCSAKINNNYFNNDVYTTITVYSGSPTITGNSFDCHGTGINVQNAYATISSNFIKSTGNYGIYSMNNAYISDNNITGCTSAVYVSGNSTVTRNLLTSNIYGVRSSSTAAKIENNVIANNQYGVSGGGTIRSNTVGNNLIGVDVSLAANVTQNNILSNTQSNIRMSMSNAYAIDASNNWWGTTDLQAINQTILDYKTNPAVGKVNFMPFLNESNPQAPSIQSLSLTPAPTPTPYPTPTNAPTPTLTPRPTMYSAPASTSTPTPIPTATPTPTPSPIPTPTPTPKIMPGSPLSLGNSAFSEALSQFDLMGIAKIVLLALGIMWALVILFYVDRGYGKEKKEKKAKKS